MEPAEEHKHPSQGPAHSQGSCQRCHDEGHARTLTGYHRLPAVSWRIRYWIVLPVALFYAYVGATSPRNPWDFTSNFALSYSICFVMSFLFLRVRPRERGHTLPRASVITESRR